MNELLLKKAKYYYNYGHIHRKHLRSHFLGNLSRKNVIFRRNKHFLKHISNVIDQFKHFIFHGGS